MRAFVGLLGAALATTGAVAQDAGPQDAKDSAARPDAIVVTGFGVADLDALGIRSTGQLLGHVPNLAGASVPGIRSGSSFYLRGLGTSETIASVDSPVSLFVDGIQFSRLNGNDIGFFDVERVEVLRGTPDALFGRNSSGGAVTVRLKEPGEKFGGFVEGGYGSFDRILVRGSVDLPLGDKISVKVSAFGQDDDGYAKNNLTGERFNDDDRAGIRFAALVKPTERLRWNLALAYTEANGENLLALDCDPVNPDSCGGRYGSTGMTRAARLGGFSQYDLPISGRKAGFTLGNALSTTLLTSDIEWGGDRVKLQLLTGFADLQEEQALDYADGRGIAFGQAEAPVRGFANGGYAVLNDGSHRQFSQDVRLSGEAGWLRWVAGASVQDETTTNDIADMMTEENGTPEGVPTLLADRVVRNSMTAWAGYVQVDARPMEALTVSAGLRYTDEEKQLSVRDNRGDCATALLRCLNGEQEMQSKVWAPNLAVSFAASDSILLFARAARGYRSGGWNARGLSVGELRPFDAQTAWTYEAGLKSQWFDGRLRAGLTGFVLDASSTGVTQLLPDIYPGPVIGAGWYLIDTGGMTNKGVELDLAANPLDGLGLYLNLGWQDATYDGFVGSAPAFYAPDLTLAFGGSYDFPIPSAGIVAMPSVDVLYRSDMQVAFDARPEFQPGSSWQVNLSLALKTDDDNWQLALTCENCLNGDAREAGVLGYAYLNRPSTWLLRAKRRF